MRVRVGMGGRRSREEEGGNILMLVLNWNLCYPGIVRIIISI